MHNDAIQCLLLGFYISSINYYQPKFPYLFYLRKTLSKVETLNYYLVANSRTLKNYLSSKVSN